MERIEEFTRDGKNFMYIDASNFRKNEEFIKIIDAVKKRIVKYPAQSVHTILNIENIIFDWETREIGGNIFKHNAPYVKYGSIIGVDGVKKFMVNAVLMFSGRKNIRICDTKEDAIAWILKQSY